jgi:adenine-specific DNA-methyltransferase
MNFIENESEQKLRGGYYTPLDLASYIAGWALAKSPTSVLEPSCGDGAFLGAISKHRLTSGTAITAFEIDKAEAEKARICARLIAGAIVEVHSTDFLDWAIGRMSAGDIKFDSVVGNPPFIRYQYLPATSQEKAEVIFDLLNLPFTKHTNAWVPFVLASISLLKPGGRLGMILPAEIMHVMHAQALRTFLGHNCSRLLIIDPEELWFDGTLQGAVILLAEKKRHLSEHSDGLGIAQVKGRSFLEQKAELLFDRTRRINGKTVEGKWTRALLSHNELSLIDQITALENVYLFKDIAQVDVGLVTGANKFFLVHDETVQEFGLQKFAHPMFGRSDHCPGVIYDAEQHAQNTRKGNPTNFIWLNEKESALPTGAVKYVRFGESQKLHTRYKCSIRSPWYTVPSVYTTKIGMLKRSHNLPRLIYNRLGAYTTDTAYRINTAVCTPEKLVYCFINPLTALSAELEGRFYGGGVLELVPSEIERLIVPLPRALRPQVRKLDVKVRTENIDDVLLEQGKNVLGPLGISLDDQKALHSAWQRLRDRRQRVTEPLESD